jgi:hypothetical protein
MPLVSMTFYPNAHACEGRSRRATCLPGFAYRCWLSLVGHKPEVLGGADYGRPRVDLHDLEDFSDSVIALTGGGHTPTACAASMHGCPAAPIDHLGTGDRRAETAAGCER